MHSHHHHHHGYQNPWFLLWLASDNSRYAKPSKAYRRFVTIFVIWPLMLIWAGWIGLAVVTAGFIVYCLLGF